MQKLNQLTALITCVCIGYAQLW